MRMRPEAIAQSPSNPWSGMATRLGGRRSGKTTGTIANETIMRTIARILLELGVLLGIFTRRTGICWNMSNTSW